MTPNISASTAVLYNTRILNANPATLTEADLAARTTLVYLNAILALRDSPSASCLGSKVISDYHAAWISTLPQFNRVGYLSVETDFYTSEKVIRLYVLADWLDTREARAKREAQLRENSETWLEERIRWYRLRRVLQDIHDIGRDAAQAQIESHFATLRCRYELAREATKQLLKMLGFEAEISTDDRSLYHRCMESALAGEAAGHAYSSVLDFKGMP